MKPIHSPTPPRRGAERRERDRISSLEEKRGEALKTMDSNPDLLFLRSLLFWTDSFCLRWNSDSPFQWK